MKSLRTLLVFCVLGSGALYAPALHDAVKSNDWLRVKQVIAQDTTPSTLNQRDDKGKTALDYAGDKTQIAETLIFYGVNPRADGDNILVLAAGAGNDELVTWLMTQGLQVQPNGGAYRAAVKGGFTAIAEKLKAPNPKNPGILFAEAQMALEKKDWTIVRQKVEEGLDVNAPFENGNRLLHLAVKAGLLSEVKFLIARKADLNSRNDFDETPILFAFNKPEIFSALVDAGADIKVNDGKLLELAAKAGSLPIVKELIRRGLKVHADGKEIQEALKNGFFDVADYLISTDARNKTFLAIRAPYALEKKEWDLIKKLVSSGLDVGFKDAEDNTLLHLAVQQNQSDMVQFLLKAGAVADVKNKVGLVPLMYAASNVGMIKLLDEKGVNIHAGNDQLLLEASKKGSLDAVRYLVNKKARLIDDAAIRAAYDNGFEAVGDFLADNFPALLSREEQVVKAVRDDDKAQLKRLKDQKFALSSLVKRGAVKVAPLWFAIRGEKVGMVEQLLKEEVDPNVMIKSLGSGVNEIQVFPIHAAAAGGNVAIVKQLVENPAQKDKGANAIKLLMAGQDGTFTAVDLAQARDWGDVTAYLKSKGVQGSGRTSDSASAIISKII